MKKRMLLLVMVLAFFVFPVCGEDIPEWSRTGYFADENENMLSVTLSDTEGYEGWFVGLVLGEDWYGNVLQQVGYDLHGDVVPDYEEGEFIVTISEEGAEGLALTTGTGEVYHFIPKQMEEAAISVTFDTEGPGAYLFAEGAGTEWDNDGFPYTFSQFNINEPEVYTFKAQPWEDCSFIKWTRDGMDYSADEQITVVLDESARYTAVFDWNMPFEEEEYSGAADETEQSAAFRSFVQNAEGRYFASTDDGFAVLEMIPAFGRLFASVGYYMGENSLYSYYAAELIPLCQTENADCDGVSSDSSYDLNVRLFSNMSIAGNYWPGETVQRLTLIPGGLLLSNYRGDGDALISKENTLLKWNGEVPGIFPYGPAEAEMMSGTDATTSIPGSLSGTFGTSRQEDGTETAVKLSLSPDGTILMLRDQGTELPPLLLKGGFSVSEADGGSYRLCYLTSSPSSGTMPYSGCVSARPGSDGLVISKSDEGPDDLLIPYNAEEEFYVRYQRAGDGS